MQGAPTWFHHFSCFLEPTRSTINFNHSWHIQQKYFVVDYNEQAHAHAVNEALKTNLQGVQGAAVWFHNFIQYSTVIRKGLSAVVLKIKLQRQYSYAGLSFNGFSRPVFLWAICPVLSWAVFWTIPPCCVMDQ